ncbi:uncharacterized protein [Salmo salar]|uniref:Uncharacterized protein LOC106570351 n=1 Tax=Salmo salar TaxID=8030 RepID=A0A1S3M498_SALSA|nr:uncharacterized protein LOC106570351 [Salmo salar]XP_045550787.1 uncharacterized protein LOC106570351 [Salmo salar]|eukprot:XP_013998037.1 PREDICTED: uncharacterized protein LOC106570351 [Salmo salar]
MASAGYQDIKNNFIECGETRDAKKYRKSVSDTVCKHRHASITLKKPEKSEWKIGGLDDTCYKGEEEVKEWGNFYLPDSVTMEVLGAVENLPYPTESGQLVIMLCEDRQVYAYDGEEMHLVALSLKEVFDSGLQYPGFKSFYRGECFKDMTKEDWDMVRQGSVGRILENEHQKLLRQAKPSFLSCLNSIKGAGACSYPEPVEPPTVLV